MGIDNMIVMYGAPPGTTGEPWPPRTAPPVPSSAMSLAPCPTCNRHIHVGTMCPFCFAEQIAKSPTRAALESVKKSLEAALKIVNEALEASK